MAPSQARRALLDIAASDGDVAEGALWLAAEDDPSVQPWRWLGRIDELAAELSGRCGIEGCGPADAPRVAVLLRDRLRLRGAGGGDPRAHYLHRVLEHGAGIPIACSAIWIAVGRRASIPLEGVNLPGHFVVRVGDQLFDALDGTEPLSPEAAIGLMEHATGGEMRSLEPRWLAPAGTADILLRMSRNLRGCYTALGRWDLALRAADRCVALSPATPADRRDRGLLHWRAGAAAAALADLRAYLVEADEACDRAEVEQVAGRLRALLN